MVDQVSELFSTIKTRRLVGSVLSIFVNKRLETIQEIVR